MSPAQYSSDLPVDLIIDESAQSGSFNMSMDEALLELGGARTSCVCRIYRWSEPTVTLGYFQATQAEQASPFPGLPVVRRLSGGGAILHDQELTYSCILPMEHPVRHDPSQLYELVHEGLIRLISDCGLPCCLRSDYKHPTNDGVGVQEVHGSGTTPPAEAFLCFLRQNPNDIVDAKTGFKIVGSAQRRRRGVILQHGSILLKASSWASGIPGIVDLNPLFETVRFTELLPSVIAAQIGGTSQRRPYSEEELAVSADIHSKVLVD